jgi:hypothetical protein
MAFKIRKARHKYVERRPPVRVAHTNYKTTAIATTTDKRIHFTITMELERREKRSNTNKKQKKDKRIESIFRVSLYQHYNITTTKAIVTESIS